MPRHRKTSTQPKRKYNKKTVVVPKKIYPEYVQNFIDQIVKVIPDGVNRMMIASHFNNMIGKVIQITKDQDNTPSILSARKNFYRGMSQQI